MTLDTWLMTRSGVEEMTSVGPGNMNPRLDMDIPLVGARVEPKDISLAKAFHLFNNKHLHWAHVNSPKTNHSLKVAQVHRGDHKTPPRDRSTGSWIHHAADTLSLIS